MKTSKSKINLLALFITCLALSGLVSVTSAQEGFLSDEDLYGDDVQQTESFDDPLESINRYTFKFNDFVYVNLLQPLVDGYTAITPDPIEKGASNFFRNLRYPVRLAGNLLQGRFQGAWVETGRFAMNSTVGLAGVMTPGDSVDGFAAIPAEDVGQALGAWGIGEGAYLVLPLLGPSNLRDLGGLIGDRAVNPLDEPFSAINDWNWEWQLAFSATEFVVASPSIMDRYKQMKGTAIDPYGSLKNAYMQYRRTAVDE
jgi:phospholipid-binding lipoprotein MlaA